MQHTDPMCLLMVPSSTRASLTFARSTLGFLTDDSYSRRCPVMARRVVAMSSKASDSSSSRERLLDLQTKREALNFDPWTSSESAKGHR